jgi:hypothetical protein
MIDQHAMDFAFVILDDAAAQLFVMHAADALEDMAEWTVAQVMQQRGDEADHPALFIDGKRPRKLI